LLIHPALLASPAGFALVGFLAVNHLILFQEVQSNLAAAIYLFLREPSAQLGCSTPFSTRLALLQIRTTRSSKSSLSE
jgi:hypothetical protein